MPRFDKTCEKPHNITALYCSGGVRLEGAIMKFEEEKNGFRINYVGKSASNFKLILFRRWSVSKCLEEEHKMVDE